jgi:hypothetical protein
MEGEQTIASHLAWGFVFLFKIKTFLYGELKIYWKWVLDGFGKFSKSYFSFFNTLNKKYQS